MIGSERTYKCIENLNINAATPYNDGNELNFHKGREYQVDIFPLYYQVYQNGGWDDYIFMTEEEFNKELYQYDNSAWINKEEKNDEMHIDKDGEDEYFEKLSICEKLYPNMKMEDLLGCIKLIIDFYEDMSNEENKDVKAKN